MNVNVQGSNVSGAEFDETGTYRYRLWRNWGHKDDAWRLVLGVIMLNPSTADAAQDDPTIRRVIRYAKAWRYDGIEVCNLYAYRATNPADLHVPIDPTGGVMNEAFIDSLARNHQILLAWGTGSGAPGFAELEVQTIARLRKAPACTLMCLGTTFAGHPRHPLYLSNAAQLAPYPTTGATL